jgi:hypothetical protein
LNDHAGTSLDTFAEEIADPGASRVFARSPFAYGHDPDATFADTFVALLVRRQPVVAALPPQAATSDPATVTSNTLRVARVRKVGFISPDSTLKSK